MPTPLCRCCGPFESDLLHAGSDDIDVIIVVDGGRAAGTVAGAEMGDEVRVRVRENGEAEWEVRVVVAGIAGVGDVVWEAGRGGEVGAGCWGGGDSGGGRHCGSCRAGCSLVYLGVVYGRGDSSKDG